MRVKSGAVSSAIWQVLDLISQWRDPYDTERLQHIPTPRVRTEPATAAGQGHAGIGHSGTRAGTAL